MAVIPVLAGKKAPQIMSDPALELRRLSRLHHASSRVSQAMVQAHASEEFVPQICQRLVSDGGFVLAWIGRRQAQTAAVVPIAWSATSPCDLEQIKLLTCDGPDGGSLAGAALSGAKTVVWQDYGAHCQTPPARQLAKQAGLRAAAAFPMQCGVGAPGVLALYSSEVNPFSGKEISLLEEVAEIISMGLLHLEQEARQKAELADERSFLRALMENSENLIYFKDLNSRFIRCSQGQHERFGSTPQNIVGKTDFDFFREEHAREAFADEQNIIRTGVALAGKIEKETWKTGQDSWCITAKMPLRNDAGEIIGTFGISKDFTAVKQAEAKLEEMHRQLVEASRVAGMAEVATSILHNVGNVLNSVNVSSSVLSEKIRNSKVASVTRLAALLQENAADLPAFFSGPKGRQVPSYLAELASHLAAERDELLREIQSLNANIEHIKEIVAAQQSYAHHAGVIEPVKLTDLAEDALGMHKAAMGRHAVQVIREYHDILPILVDKHKVLQILINLLHNSKYALDEGGAPEKRLVLRVENNGPNGVRLSVIDNGVGIAPENLARVFEHGFTTRKEGHGFGLHSGAITARELGGSLTAHSEGVGKGATFILELPCQPKTTAP
jgi:PAS domain S-box-containing protein